MTQPLMKKPAASSKTSPIMKSAARTDSPLPSKPQGPVQDRSCIWVDRVDTPAMGCPPAMELKLVDPQFTAVIFLGSAPEVVDTHSEWENPELVLVLFFLGGLEDRSLPSKPQGPDRSCTGPLDRVETP